MTLDSYSYTNQGGRSYNQDAVGTGSLPEGAVFVVADGLGGHRDGELASKRTVDTILACPPAPEEALGPWLEKRIAQANADILALQQERRSNMKSTVAALAVSGGQAVWANVGDSRVYYLHGRAIEKITEDHSVAYKKYKSGSITRAQIGMDEDQSCLLRVLGNSDRNKPDVGSPDSPIEPGDGFFLCSDGMWEYLLDEEILIDFLKAETAQDWAEQLLLRAMDRIRPKNDNLSLITVMVHG